MNTNTILMTAVALMTAAGPCAAGAEPDADAQVAGLEQMCEQAAAARISRQEAITLYERLGKEEGINRLTKEIVRLHQRNPAIKAMFDGLDGDAVAGHVADFMVSGMGGPGIYVDRPSLPDSHRHLHLTNADFMSAGGDVIQAMRNLEYGQAEIDDVVCALVALRPLVVLD